MELHDLKSGWQNASTTSKTEQELLSMTKIGRHPSLKRIRLKLIAETIFLVMFLAMYYDWFDGDKKPFYANVLLVAGLLIYIANDVIGYISLANPIVGSNLKISINNYTARIKRLSVTSLIASFLYSVCFISFFVSVINFNKEKSFILLGMIILLIQATLWSQRVWKRWIKSLNQQVQELNISEDV